MEDCGAGAVTLVQDLLRVTDGVEFHRPDTYSLNYYARVLGLRDELVRQTVHHPPHPKDNSNNDQGHPNDDDDGKVSTQKLLEYLSSNSTDNDATVAVPPKQSLDPIFQIPPRGTFPDHVKFWGSGNDHNDDHEPQQAGSLFDPLYQQLMELPPPQTVRVPVTAAQHSKLLQLAAAAASSSAVAANSTTAATGAAADATKSPATAAVAGCRRLFAAAASHFGRRPDDRTEHSSYLFFEQRAVVPRPV